jgi:hypothetical protein
MLDTFVKIVEKCTELLRERKKQRQEVFKQVISPLFAALPELVEDYLLVFHQARECFTPDTEEEHDHGYSPALMRHKKARDFMQLATTLKSQRLKLLHQRIAIRALARQLGDDYEDCRPFAGAVGHLFAATGQNLNSSSRHPFASVGRSRIMNVIYALEGSYPQSHFYLEQDTIKNMVEAMSKFEKLINETGMQIEFQWSVVVAEYAKLRQKYLLE